MYFVKLNYVVLNSLRFPQLRFAMLYASCVALYCVPPLHCVQLCSDVLLLIALRYVTLCFSSYPFAALCFVGLHYA